MRLSRILTALLLTVAGRIHDVAAQTDIDSQWPIHNDGYTDVVQWDHYSPMINGERFFLWSGEVNCLVNVLGQLKYMKER